MRRSAIPVDVVLKRSNAGVFASRAARRDRDYVTLTATLERVIESRSPSSASAASCSAEEYSHVLVATEDPGRLPTRARRRRSGSHWLRGCAAASRSRRSGPATPSHRSSSFAVRVWIRARSPRVRGALSASARPSSEVSHRPAISRLRPLVIESEPAPDERARHPDNRQMGTAWHRVRGGGRHDSPRICGDRATLHLLSAKAEALYSGRIGELPRDMPSIITKSWNRGRRRSAQPRPSLLPIPGAMHVAGMIGTPVVGVFPRTRDYVLQVARWAPWAAPHRIVPAGEDWPSRVSDALAHLLPGENSH